MRILVNVAFNVNGSETGAFGMDTSSLRPSRVRMDGISNKEYIFAAYEGLTVGDIVVVDTRNGYHLATVTSIAERLPRAVSMGDLKEVVCKADFKEFYSRKEKREKANALKSEMDKKVKVLQSQAIYELLAEKDPSLKEMLDEYKELIGD